MRFAGAYRSLPRPSSASEPSHPPNSILSVNLSSVRGFQYENETENHDPLIAINEPTSLNL